MTISPWLIYFADLCDSLNYFFITIALSSFLLIFFTLCLIIKLADDTEELKDAWVFSKKYFWIFLSIFMISLLGAIFTPSSATAYKMLIIPTAVNSQVVQKLPDELQQFIDKELQVKENK